MKILFITLLLLIAAPVYADADADADVDYRAEASRREVSIKSLSRAKKLELILLDNTAIHGYAVNLDRI